MRMGFTLEIEEQVFLRLSSNSRRSRGSPWITTLMRTWKLMLMKTRTPLVMRISPWLSWRLKNFERSFVRRKILHLVPKILEFPWYPDFPSGSLQFFYWLTREHQWVGMQPSTAAGLTSKSLWQYLLLGARLSSKMPQRKRSRRMLMVPRYQWDHSSSVRKLGRPRFLSQCIFL